MSKSWYAFIYGDPLNVLSYAKLTTKHGCLCGNMICAIYATDDDRYPLEPFSSNMQQYIKNALVTGQLQPEVPFDAKKYVYLKI